MAFLKVNNTSIIGLAAAVPSVIKEIVEQECFSSLDEAERTRDLTHVERTRIVQDGVHCSDLCYEAADRLLNQLNWNREEIDALVYVSLSRDYLTPPTSCLLQDRLGLSKECMTFDLPFACSGYVYGMSILSSMISTGNIKKALMLVGETTSKWQSSRDKTLWPLHGDAGTATALMYNENAAPLYFHLNTDGSRGDAIINVAGGMKHPITPDDLIEKEVETGVFRNNVQSSMDGMGVFSFAIKEPGQGIAQLCDHFSLPLEQIDYLLLHQANKYIDDKIGKKLKIPADKIPYSIKNYGNTSAASIPMTMVVGIGERMVSSVNHVIMCGFGSGLSWGSCYATLDHVVCLPIIEVK